MPGFPWDGQFTTEQEIADYFAGDRIVCLLCGQMKRNLVAHVLRIHDVTEADYKARFGLPWSRGLTSADAHERYVNGTKLRLEENPGERDRVIARAKSMYEIVPGLGAKRPMQPFHKKIMLRITSDREAAKQHKSPTPTP